MSIYVQIDPAQHEAAFLQLEALKYSLAFSFSSILLVIESGNFLIEKLKTCTASL